MDHRRPDLAPSSRPRKQARLAAPLQDDEPSPARTRAQLSALVEALAAGTTCAPAWSCTNLLAVPSPSPPPAPSLLGPPHSFSGPAGPPTITVSHFTGSPTSPRPRLSFSLELPTAAASASISHLSFSPCGCYLLAVTKGLDEDAMTVFEQKQGCINEWEVCWSERVARFGEDTPPAGDVKRFVGMRWLGEPRNWFPSPEASPKRPLFCAPPRSPPVTGAAFVAVLSSSELLFVHLPRSIPLTPLIVALPLQPPLPHLELTLTALPTAPTSATTLPLGASPQNAIDALVANLVDGMPTNGPSPSVVVGALGLGAGEGATGGEALKEELRAAEAGANASKLGQRRTVTRAALGLARLQNAPEAGETTFLIASTSKSTLPSPTKRDVRVSPAAKAALAPATTMLDLTAASSPDDYSNEFTDFSALDEAFGGSVVPPPKLVEPVVDTSGERLRAGEEDRHKRLELCEVKVEMSIADGPRLTVRPLPPVYLCDPMDSENSNLLGELTHLEWLEDVELPQPPNADRASQGGVDLRLLAVTASSHETSSYPTSSMTSWAFSNEPLALSEAFAGLECKKGDATTGVRGWSARRDASRSFEGLVSLVDSKAGIAHASFAIGEVQNDPSGAGKTRVAMLHSASLESLTSTGEILLPGSELYSGITFSANRGLLCAAGLTARPSARHVLAATPLDAVEADLPQTLATRLAMSLARQLDASDLIGRIIGLKGDTQTLAIVRQVRDHLQAMLAPPRRLENSALLLELLGLISTLYTASFSLSLRGSIASDIVKLATVVRAFKKCEKKDRAPAAIDTGYRCESDAVWPLIGHAGWYCDFARDLANECGTRSLLAGDSGASPRQILLLHPFVRALLLQATECILGLQAFLGTFPLYQNMLVDTAKTILDDVVDFNGLVLSEWKSVLLKVAEVDGATGDSQELRDLLINLSLSAPLSNSTTAVSSLLLAPALFLPPSLPTPPPTPAASLPLDVIRRSRLAETGDYKLCLRCGEKAERRTPTGNETGKWTAFELGWEGRCACGGSWMREVK